jgi:hypothetical protein
MEINGLIEVQVVAAYEYVWGSVINAAGVSSRFFFVKQLWIDRCLIDFLNRSATWCIHSSTGVSWLRIWTFQF